MSGERLQGPETAHLVAARDDDEKRRSLVDGFLLALLVLTAALVLLDVWSSVRAEYPEANRHLVVAAVVLAIMIAAWLLNRRGLTAVATWLCLLVIFIASTLYFEPDVLDRVLVVYAVPVVAGAFLLRPRAAFVFGALGLLGYTGVWLAYRATPDYNYIAVFALAALSLVSYLVASRWRQVLEVQEEYRRELERDVAERERAEDELGVREQELARVAERLRAMLAHIVEAMVAAVELHDPATAGHQRRVANLSVAIGRELGLSGEAMATLRMAAVLHDVGMSGVPAPVLAKPGRLSPGEQGLVQRHPDLARPILELLDADGALARIVAEHHERMDGSGYPRGLTAGAIHPQARIIAVADTVEAMLSSRPHRPGRGLDEVLAELREGSGTRYDGEVVSACLRVVEQGFAFTA